MIRIASFFIIIYQKIGQIFLPRACRFHPRCSDYALEALNKHGFLKGTGMACKRILRCHPFSDGGYDPVE